MHHSKPQRSRRRVGTVAVTVALSLSPIFLPASIASAETAVTGLAQGDSGSGVREVQEALMARGHSVPGGADGQFGAGTVSALQAFQRAEGIPASGTVDLATAIALGLESNRFYGLGPGDEGGAVMTLQQELGFAGVSVEGDAVGVYGTGTTEAVKTYQRSLGYSPTGSINAPTAVALAGVAARPARPAESSPVSAPQPRATTVDDAPDESGDGAADHDGIDTGASADDGAQRKPGDPSAEVAAASVSSADLIGLRIGSRGDAVRGLQQLLIDAGFDLVGGADGIYGVVTANAVRSFQFANDLDETGAVDQATASALLADRDAATDDRADDGDATTSLEGLRFGSVGADVRALQEALMTAGIEVRGGADGRFGSVTLAALKDYQAREGLEVTGVVDRATADALTSARRQAPYAHLLGLQAGAVGKTVQELQQLLMDLGVSVRGGADGIYGPATAAAVKEFQQSQGIAETGKVDEATVAALASPAGPQGLTGGGSDDDHDDDDDGDDDHDHDDGPGTADGFASYGERGPRVTELQRALVAAGIELRGGVDGVFGGATAAAVMEYQRQHGIQVTGRVDAATAGSLGLEAAPAPTPPDASSVQLEVFPMQGPCGFTDTWGAPRSGGRTHEGTDIIAAEGNELYAVADGTITKIYVDSPGALAGNGVRLTMDNGTYFFYAHMVRVADGLGVGDRVEAGDVVGYNGETGNAGTPHLHFEVHPNGGAAVNPYPFLKPIDAC